MHTRIGESRPSKKAFLLLFIFLFFFLSFFLFFFDIRHSFVFIKAPITTLTDKEEKFMNWLDKNGVDSKLSIAHFYYYGYSEPVRGAIATETIKEQDPVIEVPLKLMIGKFNFPPNFYHPGIKKISDCAWIGLFILHEQQLKKKSKWNSFIQLVQESSLDQPIFWPDEKLEQSSEIVQYLVARQKKKYKNEYARLFPKLSKDRPELFGDYQEKYTFEKFTWAHAMCDSRCWFLPMDAEEKHYSTFMAPGADLLNFGKAGTTIGHYDPKRQVFIITAHEQREEGQEVTYYYTDECADVVLVEYGFTNALIPPCPSNKLEELKAMYEREED